jgi:hypothetical protein
VPHKSLSQDIRLTAKVILISLIGLLRVYVWGGNGYAELHLKQQHSSGLEMWVCTAHDTERATSGSPSKYQSCPYIMQGWCVVTTLSQNKRSTANNILSLTYRITRNSCLGLDWMCPCTSGSYWENNDLFHMYARLLHGGVLVCC